MEFNHTMTDLSKSIKLSAWPGVKEEIVKQVTGLLGDLPKPPKDRQFKILEEYESKGKTARRRIGFYAADDELVTGWLFVPEGTKEEVPGILCCHGFTPYGKDEPAGLEGDTHLALAQHYAERGYATLAVDMPTAGERAGAKRKPFDAEQFHKDNPGLSLAGKALSDHMQAIAVFGDLKRVDPARIGVIGHGLGAFNALLLAGLDSRVQACVASCGFTRLATDKTPGVWPEDEGLVLLPKAVKIGAAGGNFPVDWEHILALAAPTAVQIITSLSNSMHANPKSCQKAVATAGKIYKMLGAESALDHYTNYDGRDLTETTLEVADEWFERWL